MRSACSLDQPYRHKGASSSTDSILPKSEGLTLTPMNGLISLIYQYCLYVYDVYVRLVIVIVHSPFLIKTSHERLIWHWIIHALGSFSCGFRSFEFEAITPSHNHSIVSLETLIGYWICQCWRPKWLLRISCSMLCYSMF